MTSDTARSKRRIPFASDGCTASPELFYHHCCTEHDRVYSTGTDSNGNPITRAEADSRFLACMKAARKSLPITGLLIPTLYYLAVRIFGASHWKNP